MWKTTCKPLPRSNACFIYIFTRLDKVSYVKMQGSIHSSCCRHITDIMYSNFSRALLTEILLLLLLLFKPFKKDEKFFLFYVKRVFLPVSRYLNFCLDFLVIQKKRLDQKDKVNFKFYDVTTWLSNNYNTHFAQYRTI